MLITKIKWYADDEDVDLPNKVEVPDEFDKDYEGIADYLLDKYGFCVKTFLVDMKDDKVEGKVS
jgi:hypothetical protein